MTEQSLQDLIDSKDNLVDFFWNDTVAPHAKDRNSLSPVPVEVTNWRDEQRAWRETAVLFDQSHHMPELFLKGPEALNLLMYLGINSFKNFAPGRAKQYVCCNYNGQVIGECILYYRDEESFELVSGMHLQNWVEYNALTGNWDVTVERDLQTSQNPGGADGRTRFRYQIDGPNAEKIFQEVVEGEAPDIPFFRTAKVRIAGCELLVLRHGMAGHRGVEISGPYADREKVRAALMAAGEKYGLKRAGQLAYWTTATEGGWIAYPLPAVYTDPKLRAYREWLPASSWEGSSQIGGSFVSGNIEDYYVTPWDLNVARLMKFDRDFVGREALEKMAQEEKHRTKVTLVWNKDDVMRIHRSMLEDGVPFKYLSLPYTSYAFQQNDIVQNLQGEVIGLSGYGGYTSNERELVSLAMIDETYSTPGTEVVLTWGEPNGGSRKPHVEKHQQTQIRATVATAPFGKAQQLMRADIGKK